MKVNQKGFTLIELLVVTAILGILIGISTTVFIGIMRAQNKTTVTNEVRQNAALVIDLFERDVRSADGFDTTNLPLELAMDIKGQQVIWRCIDPVPGTSNGTITREETSDETLTNDDVRTGVSVVCGTTFDSTGSQIVKFSFHMEQGVLAPTRSDYNISLPFETTVGMREF